VDSLVTRQDIHTFVWRELLKHPKEEIVALRLRYGSLAEWAATHTDLVDRVAIGVLPHLREELSSWEWPENLMCPLDIHQALGRNHLEFVLANNSYPLAY